MATPRFRSMRVSPERVIDVDRRPGVRADWAEDVANALDSIPWSSMDHAYGPAGEVATLLLAVSISSDAVRGAAWWELWGNVHHQGTVYSASPLCVPFIGAIAADRDHPDRVNALVFLRSLAQGDGSAAEETRAEVKRAVADLLTAPRRDHDVANRALLLIAAAFRGSDELPPDLLALIPAEHQRAWDELLVAGGDPARVPADDDFAAQDRQDALEAWAFAGWFEHPDA